MKFNIKIAAVIFCLLILGAGLNANVQGAFHDSNDAEGFIQRVLDDLREVLQKIIEFVLRVYRAVDGWLERVIGFGFSDLFRLMRNILVAIIEVIIKIFEKLIELVRNNR